MSKKDYYKILGASETASADEIKKIYRKLAVKYHPDKNPGNKQAEAKFKEISEAYYVLGDEKRRKEYDEMRKYGGAGANFAGAQGFNFEDLLRQFSGGGSARGGRYSAFSDIFEDVFSGGGGQRAWQVNPGQSSHQVYSSGFSGPQTDVTAEEIDADIYVNLKISAAKAQEGGTVSFISKEGKKIAVKIPPKTKNDQKMRLIRQGDVCPGCRHRGDMILTIKIK